MNFTQSELDRLLAEGKIQGYTESGQKPGQKKEQKQTKAILGKKKNKTKEWISKNIWAWARAHKLELLTELRFDEVRKFRFDWAIVELKIAIEYEGIVSEKSRHTSVEGYSRDSEKYNLAQQNGWIVLRYTALNHKNIIRDLDELKSKKV